MPRPVRGTVAAAAAAAAAAVRVTVTVAAVSAARSRVTVTAAARPSDSLNINRRPPVPAAAQGADYPDIVTMSVMLLPPARQPLAALLGGPGSAAAARAPVMVQYPVGDS